MDFELIRHYWDVNVKCHKAGTNQQDCLFLVDISSSPIFDERKWSGEIEISNLSLYISNI